MCRTSSRPPAARPPGATRFCSRRCWSRLRTRGSLQALRARSACSDRSGRRGPRDRLAAHHDASDGDGSGPRARGTRGRSEHHRGGGARRALRRRGGASRGQARRARDPAARGRLEFAHPIVREAIYADIGAGKRAIAHARAAELLADTGAPEERIAAQITKAEPVGDARRIELLRRVAATRWGGVPQPPPRHGSAARSLSPRRRSSRGRCSSS